MPMVLIRDFLKMEATAGLFLVAAAILAMVFANGGLGDVYADFLNTPVKVQIGTLLIAKPLLLWVNDGLMAIFFLLVGLEIKREVLVGELSRRDQVMLPAVAALGGMVVPAAIYLIFNGGDPVARLGWAIPAATDIAFALGVLALLGSRVPLALKVFLTALAIIDDLGAIVIIALFYTADLSVVSLGFGALFLVGLVTLNLMGVTRMSLYWILGIALWVCVLKSGVHATLAGVALAFCIPLKANEKTPLYDLEHALHPWVAYGILPLFAFANAGVFLGGITMDDVLSPIPMGIALGLFFGKQIGVVGFSWVAIRAGLCKLPQSVAWPHFYGAALLAGIGFTMSLFIGTLAFPAEGYGAPVRIGVLGGSLISGLAGYLLLARTLPRGGVTSAADRPNPAEAG
ncbi:Na+/H+ antiporter NhaA [Limibacillus sp. MBR-115]|uniref:Na+/H+ antiporter NhaA n=1 Tax=Limibacillus sp. MBR-115 TaxID=3156465 RepID=UPI003394D9BE